MISGNNKNKIKFFGSNSKVLGASGKHVYSLVVKYYSNSVK